MASSENKYRFCIDRGGTFTDVYAEVPKTAPGAPPEGFVVLKLLSEDPKNYPDAPREGIRRILEQCEKRPFPRDKPVDSSLVEWIRMGTTVCTNALLEREGAKVVLVVTQGHKDLLRIGNQARPDIFDIRVALPEMIYEEVVEAKERVRIVPESEATGSCASSNFVRCASTGEYVEVIETLDTEQLTKELEVAHTKGCTSVAICLLHSYAFAAHEQAVKAIATKLNFTQISLSSELVPRTQVLPRGFTVAVDAYLTPHIKTYLQNFVLGFEKGKISLGGGEKSKSIGASGSSSPRTKGQATSVYFMQSDGGLTSADKFTGFKAILSGPAGGVVGYAKTTGGGKPVLGFDMGGTSTDVSRFDGSNYDLVFETETAGVKVLAPQLDINTVAAGGGSRLFFRQNVFDVGPESAKAHPGPVCYRKGGYLAVTDANLLLGRLLPAYFPKIFGPNEDEPLDVVATRDAMHELATEINTQTGAYPQKSVEEVAEGFLKVANEKMCRPIRELSEFRGFRPSDHKLACFGGAAAQHACALARTLGIEQAFIHRFAGILSAYGMGLAEVTADKMKQCGGRLLSSSGLQTVGKTQFRELLHECKQELYEQGFADAQIRVEKYMLLRYQGTDLGLMIRAPSDNSSSGEKGDDSIIDAQAYEEALRKKFRREFGFELTKRHVLVDNVRIKAVGQTQIIQRQKIRAYETTAPPVETRSRMFFNSKWLDVPVYLLEHLWSNCKLDGPCIIMNKTSTCVIDPDCMCEVNPYGDLEITVRSLSQNIPRSLQSTSVCDPILLSIFSNRFMSICEQMGRCLQRTSVSVNIKERLDFSCALFDASGNLVANAPHIPVHLGAMSDTVQAQVKLRFKELRPGDVLVTNNPSMGGSHLPDITVITPVFFEGKILFFTASRGHHAEIGGTTPGSMPSDSKFLIEEGFIIDSLKLVENGVFQDDRIKEVMESPAKKPRYDWEQKLSACRVPGDCVSDLKAQIAANSKGIDLLSDLIKNEGKELITAYMGHLQNHGEEAVRNMLRRFATTYGAKVQAKDFMDDGTAIMLTVTIDPKKGDATFDFTETGPQVYANWNAPSAITTAAVLYCLRLLIQEPIPLNSGCLKPIKILLAEGSLLKPSKELAVCSGNVLTSQRITDVILQAFKKCACSYGCMNNFSFGDETFGYYETICGGAGAGPDWDGSSAVQCHMTNTRLTDVETIERLYPVMVRKFAIRTDGGGRGTFEGGKGVHRTIEFLKDGIIASLICERRAFAPGGMNGGFPGNCGENMLESGGQSINLGGKNKVRLKKGDRITITTPGGGGYGVPREPSSRSRKSSDRARSPKNTPTRATQPPLASTATGSTAISGNRVEF